MTPVVLLVARYCRCQDKIESTVLEVQKLHTERAAAGCADKATKRLQSKARRKRSQIRALLEEMYVWQDLESTIPATRLTEDQIRNLYVPGQSPPWATVGSSAQALAVYHGRLYHAACNDCARAREQWDIVRAATARLVRWLRGALIRLRAARIQHLGSSAGRVFLLDQRMAVIQALQDELSRSSLQDA
jgi:hypothetical protein